MPARYVVLDALTGERVHGEAATASYPVDAGAIHLELAQPAHAIAASGLGGMGNVHLYVVPDPDDARRWLIQFSPLAHKPDQVLVVAFP